MKIRLLQSYGFCSRGAILDPDPPVAQLLIERGVAEKVEEPTSPVLHKQVEKPPRNKAMTEPPRLKESGGASPSPLSEASARRGEGWREGNQ